MKVRKTTRKYLPKLLADGFFAETCLAEGISAECTFQQTDFSSKRFALRVKRMCGEDPFGEISFVENPKIIYLIPRY